MPENIQHDILNRNFYIVFVQLVFNPSCGLFQISRNLRKDLSEFMKTFMWSFNKTLYCISRMPTALSPKQRTRSMTKMCQTNRKRHLPSEMHCVPCIYCGLLKVSIYRKKINRDCCIFVQISSQATNDYFSRMV